MPFSIGIVGLPNAGKSTLFRALTKKQVEIAKYPFTTIKENIGIVKVPDERLNKLTRILKPKEVIPTHIEFIDIAGLVKGASKGAGLGNRFLAKIREVDAILHLIRGFYNPDVPHPLSLIDPERDKEIINQELILADLETIEKKFIDLKSKIKAQKITSGQVEKEVAKKLSLLEKLAEALNKGKLASEIELSEEEKNLISDLHLLTLKPMLYVINLDEKQITKEQAIKTIKDAPQIELKLCAQLEAELSELPEKEALDYLKEMGMKNLGLDILIQAAYKLLKLVTFFTTQNQILQAWTVPQGTPAPKAAGKIHSDFEKGFIKAEVINWQDLIKSGGEQKAKEKGLIRTEGKEYIVQDGDVIHFRFK